MTIFIILIAHWYLSLFFQTFFLHRYASHNLYKMSPTCEKVFFILSFIFQGSSFLHPAAYAVMHRRHHAYSDTERDPHSPIVVTNIFDFNKKTWLEYSELVKQFMNDEIGVKNVPRWPKFEKVTESFPLRLLFVLFYIGIYWFFAPSLWYFLLIPLHIFMGPIHGFIVNWFGHLVGYRNFKDREDNSQNTLPVDFLMMGELYQNNHHQAPNQGNFAHRWFEMDLGYLIAFLLQKLHIIQFKHQK
ncbi:acyl-CoA desaturase [Candidatus Poribacteria bacterium]|nr:acyl-CoA desaturase [Candidatus Poribacteria bacterium]MCH2574086.1 acyl-CoA desaturase [Candidatus Poribacteria bacterium]|tara:strand:- start:395 stop:1126 length:732 start_codon:yes stop_codon:yes gene_type:complete